MTLKNQNNSTGMNAPDEASGSSSSRMPELDLELQDAGPQQTQPTSAESQKKPASTTRETNDGFSSTPFMSMQKQREGHNFTAGMTMRITSKKARRDIVLDLGHTKYLIAGTSIRPITSLAEHDRAVNYLADFPVAPLGLLNVSSEFRYAHIMARKELEDRGDLSADGKLWIYSKKKMDAAQSKILYQILPQQRYAALSQHYSQYKHGFDLYETVGLLINSMSSGDKSRIQVLALHLENTITLVAGNKNDIIQIRRYTLAGPDDISLGEGINALQQDMSSLEENLGLKIEQITWIEGLCTDPNISIPQSRIPVVAAPVTELDGGKRKFWSALPGLMSSLSIRHSLMPEDMRVSRPLEKIEPLLWAACATIIICLCAGGYAYNIASAKQKQQIRALTQQANQLQAANEQTRHEVSDLIGAASMDIPHFMAVASSLSQAATAPNCGKFWNTMSGIKPEGSRMTSFKLDYGEDTILVHLAGTFEEPMITAQEYFTRYTQKLKGIGFTMLEQKLSSGLSSSTFSLQMEWPLVRSNS